MFVVVGERTVDIGDGQVVPVGDGPRVEFPALDECVDVVDAEPGPLDARVPAQCVRRRDDAGLLFRHLGGT
jgi:hypothetical protein